jgi:very-short-patch-repair endonuclease
MAKTQRGKESAWLNRYKKTLRSNCTREELIFKKALDEVGVKFRFQSLFYTKTFQCIVDFLINTDKLKLVIEIDGEYHNSQQQKTKDFKREEWLYNQRGFLTIRFTNKEVNDSVYYCVYQLAALYVSIVKESTSKNFTIFNNFKSLYEMKKERTFTNPFSDKFLENWQLWKDFRKEEHNFQYKGVISEQMAINRLVEVAGGDEEKAVRIVNQSISRGWMDFYQLKQSSNNGTKQSTAKDGQQSSSIRESTQAEFSRRHAGGGQAADESHLKAV